MEEKEQPEFKKSRKIVIEKIRKLDIAELVNLYKQLNPNLNIDFKCPIMIDSYFNEISRTSNFNIFVLKVDGKIVSTCMFTIIPSISQGMRPNGVIESFVTDENNRRMGYGKMLIEHILEIAKDVGCLKVSLLAKNDNEAVKIYENVGFKENTRRSFVMVFD